jgi:hypothetical protein
MGRARKQLHWKHPECQHNKGLCFCASKGKYDKQPNAKNPPKRRK